MTDSKDPTKIQAQGGRFVRASDVPLLATKKQGPQWDERDGPDPGSLAAWGFSEYCASVEHLPEAGDEKGLCRLFESEPNELLFMSGERPCWFLLGRDLQRAGRKAWRWADFKRTYDKWLIDAEKRKIAEMGLARIEAERAERRERARKPGRRESQEWHDALIAAVGLQMEQRNAYPIIKEGTNNRETQKKLAMIFAADPARNYPAAWAKKECGPWGRPPAPDSFKIYALAMVDDFEADETLAALAAAYHGVGLPSNFKDIGDFLNKIEKAGIEIDPAKAASAWRAFEHWRMLK